jgi:hypothetical protein
MSDESSLTAVLVALIAVSLLLFLFNGLAPQTISLVRGMAWIGLIFGIVGIALIIAA